MNLLPHSNGVRRVNMKRQRTTKEKLKNMGEEECQKECQEHVE